MSIPKVSAPLAKAIRTSEGILAFIVTIGLTVTTAVQPSQLPPKWAGVLVAAITVLHGIQRTYLKVVAVQYHVGVGDPIPVVPPVQP